MFWGLINMTRDEYRSGHLGVRDCRVTFLGIPIYCARFTSTNNQAVRQLTVLSENKTVVCGFQNKE